MVWQRMGLLDDAIREHLELKRRRGADPGEVAREQREALDPVPREPGALLDDGRPLDDVAPGDELVALDRAGSAAVAPDAPEDGVIADGAPEDMPDDLADAPVVETASGPVGGETQELDMRSVLDDAGDRVGDLAGPPIAPAQASDGESLEWEMPGPSAEEPALEEQTDEDVLEETPEFLRDTPEQERLWFEQRPPRDFDFDK
jgi:hypothetical protein